MVPAGGGRRKRQDWNPAQDCTAVHHVSTHFGGFTGSQWTILTEDFGGDQDLANIMKKGRDTQRTQFLHTHADRGTKHGGQSRNA